MTTTHLPLVKVILKLKIIKMNSRSFNLFIVDENPYVLNGLNKYLNNRFGNRINVSTFNSSESVLKMINKKTNIVVLKYNMNGSGNDVLKSIKEINPLTEVIMLSSNEEVGVAIDSFRNGATDFVIGGNNAWKRISNDIHSIVDYPVRILINQFGISKYVAAFILSFISMGIVVVIAMQYLH